MIDDLVERTRVAAKAAEAMAAEVDHRARFPVEAVDEMRRQRLLGTAIPSVFGGDGASVGPLADCCRLLAAACPSSAMVFAMHQIQVAAVVRHGRSEALHSFLGRVAAEQLLLASATTERKVGGDLGRSICAIRPDGPDVFLEKDASVISYGDHTDAVLATARRDESSPASDQVLAVCIRPDVELDVTGGWDTLGFRGTESRSYLLRCRLDPGLLLSDPFGDILTQTMHPVSHILWASVWLGIAEGAARKAQRYVARQRRERPDGTAVLSLRLAELANLTSQMRSLVSASMASYEERADDPDALSLMPFTLQMNNLKISASQMVVEVVAKALGICGLSGYREDGEFSLGRALRDAYGAGIMVNNDRLLENNASIAVATKGI